MQLIILIAMSVTMSKKTLFIKGFVLFVFVLFITMNAIPVTSGKLAVKVNKDDIKVKNKSTQEIFFDILPDEQWNKDVWLIKVAGETELKLTFFFGYVTNISHTEGFIKFNAQNLFYLVFQPLSFGSYNSGEEIIAKQVLALTIEGNPGIVIGFYKTSLL